METVEWCRRASRGTRSQKLNIGNVRADYEQASDTFGHIRMEEFFQSYRHRSIQCFTRTCGRSMTGRQSMVFFGEAENEAPNRPDASRTAPEPLIFVVSGE